MKLTINVPNGVTDIFYKTVDGKIYQSHLSETVVNSENLYVDPGSLQRNCKTVNAQLQTNVDETVSPTLNEADWTMPSIDTIREDIHRIDGREKHNENPWLNAERSGELGLPTLRAVRKIMFSDVE